MDLQILRQSKKYCIFPIGGLWKKKYIEIRLKYSRNKVEIQLEHIQHISRRKNYYRRVKLESRKTFAEAHVKLSQRGT